MRYKELKEIRDKAFRVSDSTSIESVFAKYYQGRTRKVGSTLYIECPNPDCGGHNSTPNKCSISFSKNVYNCFACGEKGGPTGLYSRLTGKNISQSALELAYMTGGISQDEYDMATEQSGIKKLSKDKEALIKIEQRKAEEKIYQKQDDSVLNMVYEALLSMDEFQLTPGVIKYLKEVRNINEEEARKKGIFSYHKTFSMEKLFEKIREKHPSFNPAVLVGVPGFYFKYSDDTKKKGYWRFIEPSKYKTFGLAIKNAKGQIVALQQRKAAQDHSGYWWISSKNLNDEVGCDFGTSSGSPLHVEYPEHIKRSVICYTEGRFKGMAISKALNSICICTQGINSNKGSVVPTIKEILKSPITKERYEGTSKTVAFYLIPDADLVVNPEVFRGLSDISKAINENFQNRELKILLWKIEEGKGFDDLFNNHPDWQKRIVSLPALEYVKVFNGIVREIHNNTQWQNVPLKTINGNPEKRKAFYEQVKNRVYSKYFK